MDPEAALASIRRASWTSMDPLRFSSSSIVATTTFAMAYYTVLFRCLAVVLLARALEARLDHLDQCSSCNTSAYERYQACQCDQLCTAYGDCCFPAGELPWDEETAPPLIDGLECRPNTILPSTSPGDAFWMVSACPVHFNSSTLALNCSQRSNLPPVTDIGTGIVYKNEYCAKCNAASDLAMWQYRLQCSESIERHLREVKMNGTSYNVTQQLLNEECTVSNFEPPLKAPEPRSCVLIPIVSTCANESQDSALLYNCTQGSLNIITNNIPLPFRPLSVTFTYQNQYCAICNGDGGILDQYSCYYPLIGSYVPAGFSVLLDVMGNGQVHIKSDVEIVIRVTCPHTQVFDPVNSNCRPTIIYSVTTRVFYQSTDVSFEPPLVNCSSGSIIALNDSEYENLGNDTIIYDGEKRKVEANSMGQPLICVNFSRNGTRVVNMTVQTYIYPQGFAVLSYVGGFLSILGCTFILVTHIIFKELRTLPSMILMNIATAILIYTLFILVGFPIGQLSYEFCVTVAVVIQMFALAQFSWMSIMLFEMVRIYYNSFRLTLKTSTHKRFQVYLFVTYFLLGWGVPLVITVVTIAVNFSTDLVQYGRHSSGLSGSCWINHQTSLILSFVVPMAAALFFNMSLFIAISLFLFKSWLEESKLSRDKRLPYFRVYIATFSVSGLTWISGGIAIGIGTSWAWYPFVILIGSQGLFIFLAFLFTKKVGRLYLSSLTSVYYSVAGKRSSAKVV